MEPLNNNEILSLIFGDEYVENGRERLKITEPEVFKKAVILYVSVRYSIAFNHAFKKITLKDGEG